MTSNHAYLGARQGTLEYDLMELNLTDYTEHNSLELEDQIDPDNMFLSSIPTNCKYFTENDFNNSVESQGKFSVIHFNSRSMYANFNTIKEYLQQLLHPFSIIAVSETWFNDDKGIDFELNDYNLNYVNRTNKSGGGVAIYVNKKYKYRILENMTVTINDMLECLSIEIINEKKKNCIVSCLYRSPGSCVEMFTNWMEKTFSLISNKKIFICGDYNIDLINPSNNKTIDDYMSRMYSMSLFPVITRPSRITSHSATLIDNIFTNNMESTNVSGLLICDITDHLPVFTMYEDNSNNQKLPQKYRYIREKTHESINALYNDLMEQDWNAVYSKNDVDTAFDIFLEIFTLAYNKNCPIRQISKNNTALKCPWLTKGLQNACKKKNALYKQFIRLRTEDSEQRYKLYKNKLTEVLRTRKKLYYTNLINNNKNNIKEVWSILNSIIKGNTKNKVYPNYFVDKNIDNYNMNEVVESFNNFFVNVGPDLAAKVPKCTSNNPDTLIKINPKTMFLSGVTVEEIMDVVNNCKNKISTDCFDINMSIVKQIISSIAKPLTYICNLSFQTGAFPKKMKLAKVIPLYKNGNKHIFTNYRPVSLLPQFSKILEKLFNNRLEKFTDKHNLINESQYGFRIGRSTTMAIIDAVEEITNSLDKKKYAAGVFIDLKKAFDTIDHSILLRKLERYGIRGVALSWIQSYLTGRQQYVKMGENASGYLDIGCGVPQGSVLGPRLFILYINDIFQVSTLLKLILFADDTNIFYSNDDYNNLIHNINNELMKLKTWMDINKLSLNLSKTKVMFFGNYNPSINTVINIDGVSLDTVSEIKFLGVIIDSKLNWKTHIRHIQGKVSKSISIINKAKYYIDYHALRLLYCSLILPYLTYCVEVWGNNYKSSLHALIILQKRAVRIIHKAKYYEHTNPLFLQSKLLKLLDLVDFYTVQFLFKANRNLLPVNLQKLFAQREGGYNLRGCGNFKTQAVRTTRKSLCVSICGVKLWNQLGPDFKKCPNIYQFKSRFKNMVLSRYDG